MLLLILVLSSAFGIQPTTNFHSKALQYFEPISNFELLYEGAHEPDRVNLFGHIQPYPDQIQLNFDAFNRHFSYKLSVAHDLFAAHSTMTVDDVEMPHTLTSYKFKLDESEFGSATIRPDGTVHAVIFVNNEIFQVDPIWEHKDEIHHDTLSALNQHAKHGMIIFRHSDIKTDGENLHLCGVAGKGAEVSHFEPRKLLQLPTRWTNCYPNDAVTRRLSVGWVSDLGFYKAYSNSVANVQSAIAGVFTSTNNVYQAQLNVVLTVGWSAVRTTTSSDTWNVDRTAGNCPTISGLLDALTAWTKPSTQGIWHQFTDCYPPPGTVGLAYVGVLCKTRSNTGVSTKSSGMWLTVAHEIGHNFAADHTFQLGQGSTGGIMDYGDGLLNGIYQFNTVYSKTQMCGQIAQSMSCTTNCIPQAACWSTFNPVCGNGIVESGESCDAGTANGQAGSCCTSTCALTAGSECTNGPCCVNCKFALANTTCDNGGGYCSLGTCITSFCSNYGMTYCNVRPDNLCKQRCISSGACSNLDGWYDSSTGAPLPVNVKNGTLCGGSGSWCNANGVCNIITTTTPPTTTYSWVSGTWGVCSVTCGSGSQTRAVNCQTNTGVVVADSNCNAATKPTTTQSCSFAACVTYSWSPGAWGACSNDCDGGVQTRTVSCVSSTGQIVTSTTCTGTAPPNSQSCNTIACPRTWFVGQYGSCSKACGGGTQLRTVVCQKTQNSIVTNVADSECTTTKPATSQTCNTAPCPAYTWVFGVWGACSVSCGSGTQSRSVECRDNATQVVVAESNCLTTKPATTQACNTPICNTYAWVSQPWGACSVSCGTGSQSRLVQCTIVQTGAIVADSFCTTSRPAGTQNCNTQLCTDYHWMIGQWSTCSLTCGGGQQTRSVICHDMALGNESAPVSETFCAGQIKPASTAVCNAQSCPTYTWLVGDWSSCSLSCGGGVSTRPVSCVITGTTSPVSATLCTASVPISTQACNTVACTVPAIWATSLWSTCTRACGGGTRTRTATCVDNTNTVLADTACTTTKPSTQEACNTAPCPVFWYTGEYSSCSKLCEWGNQTRIVECRESGTGVTVADSLCAGTKPTAITTCNAFPCPAWTPGPWSNCSRPCDDGVQTRVIQCISFQGVVVADTDCVHSMPATQQVCNLGPCPHWHVDPWGDCSKPCGGGVQTRNLTCHLPHDAPYYGIPAPIPALCPTIKPISSQPCNTDACTQYFWALAWSTCSLSCGGGTQTAQVTCLDSNNNVVPASLCPGSAPNNTRTCNTRLCPQYEWFIASDWSNCSKACGGGLQLRTVYCRDRTKTPPPNANFTLDTPIDIVDDSFCTALSALGPKPASVQSCNIGSNLCVNGFCVTATGSCKCYPGHYGFQCQFLSRISTVTLDTGAYTQGIPMGETIGINWDSIGDVPTVSILLKRSTWTFPQYITSNLPNEVSMTRDRVFKWTIPKGIEQGFYTITVYYAANVYLDSDVISIADPCLYVSCGQYGSCVPGVGTCNCTGGYSGTTCAITPCDTAGCNPSTSTCDVNTGRCSCISGYQGDKCYVPAGCNFQCLNNGTVFGIIVQNDAATTCSNLKCACRGYWTGMQCQTCSITCLNGGTPLSDCRRCRCPAGWFGPTCKCRYTTIKVRMLTADVATWVNNPALVSQFSGAFSSDIGVSVIIDAPRVEVVSVTAVTSTTADVTFRFLDVCQDIYNDFVPGHMYRRAVAPRTLLQSVSVDTYFDALLQQHADTTSALYKGVVTSNIDPNYTPTCSGCSTAGGGGGGAQSSSGVNTALIGGVVGGVVGAVLLIVLFYFVVLPKLRSGGSSSSAKVPVTTSNLPAAQPVPLSTASTASRSPGGAALPAGWTAEKTEDGHYFYYNTKTGESQWEIPTTPAV